MISTAKRLPDRRVEVVHRRKEAKLIKVSRYVGLPTHTSAAVFLDICYVIT